MWEVKGHEILMCEGDFGIELPIEISGTTLTSNDEIDIVFKQSKNSEPILIKTYDSIENNTVPFSLTEEESAKFPVGIYVYSVDWYQDGAFMCNIIPSAMFRVVDKA